jgi:hypothetical protein
MNQKWSDIPKTSADPIGAYEKREARGWWMVFAAGVAAIALMIAIYFIV